MEIVDYSEAKELCRGRSTSIEVVDCDGAEALDCGGANKLLCGDAEDLDREEGAPTSTS
jgi:hypothetical protein